MIGTEGCAESCFLEDSCKHFFWTSSVRDVASLEASSWPPCLPSPSEQTYLSGVSLSFEEVEKLIVRAVKQRQVNATVDHKVS